MQLPQANFTSYSSYKVQNLFLLLRGFTIIGITIALSFMDDNNSTSGNRRVILIVGVFFGVLSLVVIFFLICCLCWRRKLKEEIRDARFGDLGREISAGATVSSRADFG